MKYVSPEYDRSLTELAERLVTPERFAAVSEDIGQLALLDTALVAGEVESR